MSRLRIYGLLLLMVMALLLCPAAVPPAAAAPPSQSGQLTILFNADTRPQVPIYQSNPYPHEGLFMTCSGLGSESTVYLQLTVNGIMTSQENCDGTIEAHGLQGQSVDISAQDILGIGPVFHLIAYGLDPSATPTPTAPTATPAGLPFGCTEPGGIPFGYYAVFVMSGHFTSIMTSDPAAGYAFPLPDATNAGFISAQWVNITFSGLAGRYNLFDAGDTLLESVDMHSNITPGLRWAAPGDHVTFSTIPGFTAGPVEADFCFWYYYPNAAPSPTATTAPTSTPTVTGVTTPLPTPPPFFGTCFPVASQLVDGSYQVLARSDMFGRFWRASVVNLPLSMSFVHSGGAGVLEITDRDWHSFTVHTSIVIWTDTEPFLLEICAVSTPPPTLTPTQNVFATFTATRTPSPTSTGTLTPTLTGTPTETSTPLPTSTPPPTCSTPGPHEDTGECAILELLKTPPVIQTLVPLSTPVPNISTAVAIICERDPCASAGDMTETIGDIIVILEESSHAPNCMDFQWPTGFGGGTMFQIPAQDFAVGFCAFLDMSSTLRAWLRVLSVFFFAMIGVKYYMVTMRRVGDV